MPVLVGSLTLVRVGSKKSRSCYFTLAEYDNGWVDWEDKEPIESDEFYITHFCIPDPIEIEE